MTNLRLIATDPTATGCRPEPTTTFRVVTRAGVRTLDVGVTWWACSCRPLGPRVADPARVLHAEQPLPDDVTSPGVPSQRSEK